MEIEDRGENDGYLSLRLHTDRGPIDVRLYEAETDAGAIFVGGVGGSFDTPARGLYEQLSEELSTEGVKCLRVRFRFPTRLDEAVYDVAAGIALLEDRGAKRIGLVGHSFGGAVVISAAELSPLVGTVVTLATQSYGTEAAARLRPRSLLLIHGSDDRVLPARCSLQVHALANEPKELIVLEDAGHMLDEAAGEVQARVRAWLVEELGVA